MISMMKEPEDMTLIGPVIEKQQKIIYDCVEKKLTLSKLQSQMWQKSSDKEEDFSISDLDMDDDTFKSLLEKLCLEYKCSNEKNLKYKKDLLGQSGGFLNILIPAVITGIASIISSFISKPTENNISKDNYC